MNKRAAKAIKIGTGILAGIATGIALMASANASDGALRTSADLDNPAQPTTSKSVVVEVVPDPVEVPTAPAPAVPVSTPTAVDKPATVPVSDDAPAAPGEVVGPTEPAGQGTSTCTTVYDMNAAGPGRVGGAVIVQEGDVIKPVGCG